MKMLVFTVFLSFSVPSAGQGTAQAEVSTSFSRFNLGVKVPFRLVANIPWQTGVQPLPGGGFQPRLEDLYRLVLENYPVLDNAFFQVKGWSLGEPTGDWNLELDVVMADSEVKKLEGLQFEKSQPALTGSRMIIKIETSHLQIRDPMLFKDLDIFSLAPVTLKSALDNNVSIELDPNRSIRQQVIEYITSLDQRSWFSFPGIHMTIIIFNQKKRGKDHSFRSTTQPDSKSASFDLNSVPVIVEPNSGVVQFDKFDVEWSSLKLNNHQSRLLTSRWDAWLDDTFSNRCAALWSRRSRIKQLPAALARAVRTRI